MVDVSYATENFTFVIPFPFADADVRAGHAEAFFGGEGGAQAVEKDVRGRVFEVEASSVGGSFGLAMVLGGWEGGVRNAVGVAEAFAIVDTGGLFLAWIRCFQC